MVVRQRRPPYLVSPDDWDEQFEKEYQSWKGKTLSSSNKTIVTKADFRQPIVTKGVEMAQPGVEPGPLAYRASVLPLHYCTRQGHT